MHETAALTAVQQEMSQCVCPQQTRNASLLGWLRSVLGSQPGHRSSPAGFLREQVLPIRRGND